MDENPTKPDSLTLELCAVINRVVPNPPNRCAWFWNDFIGELGRWYGRDLPDLGRIYCYPNNYTPGLNVMECVKCKVVYTGAFDDVPWSAYDIEVIQRDINRYRDSDSDGCSDNRQIYHFQLLGEDDDVRFAAAQMLVTRDDWTVNKVKLKEVVCSFHFFFFLEELTPPSERVLSHWGVRTPAQNQTKGNGQLSSLSHALSHHLITRHVSQSYGGDLTSLYPNFHQYLSLSLSLFVNLRFAGHIRGK